MRSNGLGNFEDTKAARREQKKRPRMRQHGRFLKKNTTRGVAKIHKVTKKK